MDKKLENLKKGKKFTSDYQPTPEAKSKGKKRINDLIEGISFIGSQLKSKIKDEDGNEVELSLEANIAYKLMQKASEGDLKAIDMVFKLKGLYAPEKLETSIKEIKVIREDANKIE